MVVIKDMPMEVGEIAVEALITRYCNAWNQPSAELCHQLLVTVLAKDGIYVDPTVRVVGVLPLVDHIGNVAAKYPGSTIVRTSKVDMHHDVLRFSWHKKLANGQTLPESIDVCTIGEDGKLRLIVGFFGPLITAPATEQ